MFRPSRPLSQSSYSSSSFASSVAPKVSPPKPVRIVSLHSAEGSRSSGGKGWSSNRVKEVKANANPAPPVGASSPPSRKASPAPPSFPAPPPSPSYPTTSSSFPSAVAGFPSPPPSLFSSFNSSSKDEASSSEAVEGERVLRDVHKDEDNLCVGSLGKRLLSSSQRKVGISVSVRGKPMVSPGGTIRAASAWKPEEQPNDNGGADEDFPDLQKSAEIAKDKDKGKKGLIVRPSSKKWADQAFDEEDLEMERSMQLYEPPLPPTLPPRMAGWSGTMGGVGSPPPPSTPPPPPPGPYPYLNSPPPYGIPVLPPPLAARPRGPWVTGFNRSSDKLKEMDTTNRPMSSDERKPIPLGKTLVDDGVLTPIDWRASPGPHQASGMRSSSTSSPSSLPLLPAPIESAVPRHRRREDEECWRNPDFKRSASSSSAMSTDAAGSVTAPDFPRGDAPCGTGKVPQPSSPNGSAAVVNPVLVRSAEGAGRASADGSGDATQPRGSSSGRRAAGGSSAGRTERPRFSFSCVILPHMSERQDTAPSQSKADTALAGSCPFSFPSLPSATSTVQNNGGASSSSGGTIVSFKTLLLANRAQKPMVVQHTTSSSSAAPTTTNSVAVSAAVTSSSVPTSGSSSASASPSRPASSALSPRAARTSPGSELSADRSPPASRFSWRDESRSAAQEAVDPTKLMKISRPASPPSATSSRENAALAATTVPVLLSSVSASSSSSSMFPFPAVTGAPPSTCGSFSSTPSRQPQRSHGSDDGLWRRFQPPPLCAPLICSSPILSCPPTSSLRPVGEMAPSWRNSAVGGDGLSGSSPYKFKTSPSGTGAASSAPAVSRNVGGSSNSAPTNTSNRGNRRDMQKNAWRRENTESFNSCDSMPSVASVTSGSLAPAATADYDRGITTTAVSILGREKRAGSVSGSSGFGVSPAAPSPLGKSRANMLFSTGESPGDDIGASRLSTSVARSSTKDVRSDDNASVVLSSYKNGSKSAASASSMTSVITTARGSAGVGSVGDKLAGDKGRNGETGESSPQQLPGRFRGAALTEWVSSSNNGNRLRDDRMEAKRRPKASEPKPQKPSDGGSLLGSPPCGPSAVWKPKHALLQPGSSILGTPGGDGITAHASSDGVPPSSTVVSSSYSASFPSASFGATSPFSIAPCAASSSSTAATSASDKDVPPSFYVVAGGGLSISSSSGQVGRVAMVHQQGHIEQEEQQEGFQLVKRRGWGSRGKGKAGTFGGNGKAALVARSDRPSRNPPKTQSGTSPARSNGTSVTSFVWVAKSDTPKPPHSDTQVVYVSPWNSDVSERVSTQPSPLDVETTGRSTVIEPFPSPVVQLTGEVVVGTFEEPGFGAPTASVASQMPTPQSTALSPPVAGAVGLPSVSGGTHSRPPGSVLPLHGPPPHPVSTHSIPSGGAGMCRSMQGRVSPRPRCQVGQETEMANRHQVPPAVCSPPIPPSMPYQPPSSAARAPGASTLSLWSGYPPGPPCLVDPGIAAIWDRNTDRPPHPPPPPPPPPPPLTSFSPSRAEEPPMLANPGVEEQVHYTYYGNYGAPHSGEWAGRGYSSTRPPPPMTHHQLMARRLSSQHSDVMPGAAFVASPISSPSFPVNSFPVSPFPSSSFPSSSFAVSMSSFPSFAPPSSLSAGSYSFSLDAHPGGGPWEEGPPCGSGAMRCRPGGAQRNKGSYVNKNAHGTPFTPQQVHPALEGFHDGKPPPVRHGCYEGYKTVGGMQALDRVDRDYLTAFTQQNKENDKPMYHTGTGHHPSQVSLFSPPPLFPSGAPHDSSTT